MTNSVSDRLHAGSDSIRPALPPAQAVRATAERRRRNRRIAAVVAPVVLAALILGLGAAGELRNSATPPSPAPPGPHPSRGLLTLTSNPFLTAEEEAPVRPGAAPVALSPCVVSPLARGAAESGAATYGRRGHGPVSNEFVIRYDSVAAAHHAVIDAWRQSRRCPTPPNVATEAPHGPGKSTTVFKLSELFYSTLPGFATPHSNTPISMHPFIVGRWRNVVVVLETTGSGDRAEYTLWRAMFRATGRWPNQVCPYSGRHCPT